MEDRSELLPGRLLGKRYRLVRRLRDDSDALWRATHVGLDAEVAIKVLGAELASCGRAREQMRKSASAAARVRSPHLVQLLDHGVDDGWPYVAMELLEGTDLERRIASEGALALRRTVEIVTQIARALARAHASRLVHGDLRPEHVFLTSESGAEVVKVLGIGVTRREPRDARYVSPERRDGRPFDHREDVWALAMIVVCCATGEPRSPWSARQHAGLAGLEAWLDRAFSDDLHKRFHGARELAEALDRAVRDAEETSKKKASPRARLEGPRPASKRAPPPAPVPARPAIVAATPPAPLPAAPVEPPVVVLATTAASERSEELDIEVELAPPSVRTDLEVAPVPKPEAALPPAVSDDLAFAPTPEPLDAPHVARAISSPPMPAAPRPMRRPGWRLRASSVATLAVCALALGMAAHARVSKWWASSAEAAPAIDAPRPRPVVQPASTPVSIEASGFVGPAPTASAKSARPVTRAHAAQPDDGWIEIPLPDPE